MFFDLASSSSTALDAASIASTQIRRMVISTLSHHQVGYNKCAVSTLARNAKQVKKNPSRASARLLDRLLDASTLSRIDIEVTDVGGVNALVQLVSFLLNGRIVDPDTTLPQSIHKTKSSTDVDIVCVDLSQRMPFFVKSAPVNLAIQRGIVFEIQYAAASREPESRRHFVANASQLVKATRGKHIIVSSGAVNAFELRGPYDVINMLTVVCGFKEVDAIKAMTETPLRVLMHADTFKGAISAIKKEC